jgi:hypothetical protein
MTYVDAFISHQQRDKAKAIALKDKIKGLGFSCFIDADDPELSQKKERTVAEQRALAERIRGKLRNCRCIIYAYTAQSLESRWMPWELGFFDGRWGPRQIGLYDLDEGGARAADAPRDAGHASALEYLHIYEELTPGSLRDFLQQACSTRALADRADVDVDRLATLFAGMSRDPVNFTLDAWAYTVTLQQQFWSRIAGRSLGPGAQQPEAMWEAAMKAGEILRGALQPFAAAARPPAGAQRQSDALMAAFREGGEQALQVSRPAPLNGRNGAR